MIYGTPKLVTDGLVLALDAGSHISYNSGSTTWRDLSGRNRNGTLTNGPTFSFDKGGSLIFDGSNDYVNLDFPFTQASSANRYTLFVVAKLNSTSTGRRQIWGSDNGGFDWGFGSGDGGKFTIFTGNNILLGRDQDLNWHVFTAQWSSSGTRLWIDGILDINSTSIEFDPTIASTTSIGRNPTFGEYFNGVIASVYLYDRVLSDDEVRQNYSILKNRFGI